MANSMSFSHNSDSINQLESDLLEQRALVKKLKSENAKLQHQLDHLERDLCQGGLAKERCYRDIIDSIQEGYFETDLQGHIKFCNKALLSMLGYDPEKLIGQKFHKFTSPHNARAMQLFSAKVLKNDQDAAISKHNVYHKLGHWVTVEISMVLSRDQDDKIVGFRGVLRDISKQVKTKEKQERLQEQLSQSRKMNALGTLAGGLAHGFNNVLMAIHGNLSLIRINLPMDHPMQKNLERIHQSTEKGCRLAREILSFAKIGKLVVMPTNLNNLIKSTSRMLVRSQPDLKVHELLEEELWQTHVDRAQLSQALLSLYLNAVDAMPEGGNLYVQSENVELEAAFTRPFNADPGRYVKISVTDSGSGLEADAIERIFEPFYSAYRPLSYDQLGLAGAYGAIRSHGGIINVYSEKGKGTTFTLHLPASIAQQPAAPDPAQDHHTGSETILVVDDDKRVVMAGSEILKRHGYHTMVANTGTEALEIYARYHDQIDLVLLDLILPDIGGDHLFQEMRRYNPNATVVLTSGYNVNQQIRALLDMGCADFIQKPFQKHSLAQTIRAALDHKSTVPSNTQ